jgi:hypothetical protein
MGYIDNFPIATARAALDMQFLPHFERIRSEKSNIMFVHG